MARTHANASFYLAIREILGINFVFILLKSQSGFRKKKKKAQYARSDIETSSEGNRASSKILQDEGVDLGDGKGGGIQG